LRLRTAAAVAGRYSLTEPPRIEELAAELEALGHGDLFEQFFSGSVADLLDRYLTADDIKNCFMYLGLTSVYGGPSSTGTAYVYSHHAWGEFDGRFGQFGFVRGGMGAISESLAARARSLGARVETSAPVARISVANGEVRGVVLEDGRELQADLVVANTDPKRTFLDLVAAEAVPSDFRAQVEELDYRGTMARVHVAVDGIPRFASCQEEPDPALLGWTVLGAQRARFDQAWRDQQDGVLPEKLAVEFTTQTVHDPTLAPHGRHLITTGVLQLPFAPRDSTWDDLRPKLEKRVISTLSEYMLGLEETIVAVRTITPLDLERDYGLTGGNLFHGAMNSSQLFAARPLPGCASGRTPIAGLYLCGSGIHPGGGVTGAPGYNAARAALIDLGKPSRYTRLDVRRPKRRWSAVDQLLARPRSGEAAVRLASNARGARIAARLVG
jgi:phytoene dehydrogenase-like protein